MEFSVQFWFAFPRDCWYWASVLGVVRHSSIFGEITIYISCPFFKEQECFFSLTIKVWEFVIHSGYRTLIRHGLCEYRVLGWGLSLPEAPSFADTSFPGSFFPSPAALNALQCSTLSWTSTAAKAKGLSRISAEERNRRGLFSAC